jgi:hypothetical protein
MRLPRMTTRRWMIAVAVVALLTGMAIELRLRRVRFHAMAAHYRDKEFNPQFPYISITYKEWESLNRRWPSLRPHYVAMRKKYEFAERYPWLPVAPDPPEPE